MRACLTLCLLCLFFGSLLSAQSRTLLDGVFARAQVARSEAVCAANCTRCHGEALHGRPDPSRKGEGFIDRWREEV
jgi:cytochrome c5